MSSRAMTRTMDIGSGHPCRLRLIRDGVVRLPVVVAPGFANPLPEGRIVCGGYCRKDRTRCASNRKPTDCNENPNGFGFWRAVFCGWAFLLGKAAFSGVFDGWEIAGLDRCREGGI
jgi:hypothetical protein